MGRGATGEVYAAYDPKLDRKIALRLLSGDHDRVVGQRRMLDEAKTMARLSHANVVAVHDAGTLDGRVFIAMEYVDGATLQDWLAERPRPLAEILGAFQQAARGLAAAHQAGIAHHDFKPRHVIVGRDGTVRVTDFGLAEGTDALADQLAFCVALYQALYAPGPSDEAASEDLSKAALAGQVPAAPPRSRVPVWLRRVLLRGLAAAPADRFPSMVALIDALAADPARSRRRLALVASAVGLTALVVVGVARRSAEEPALCRAGPGRLEGTWEVGATSRTRHDVIQRAFAASGLAEATEIWTRVEPLLDRYATRWLSMYREACEATHVTHVQPATVLDLRMACLEDGRTALAALSDVLARADAAIVEKGVDAVNALPALERCADVSLLTTRVEPPRDPAVRSRVDDLRRRGAAAKALNDTGQHEASIASARVLLAEARALGYQPAVGQMLKLLSDAQCGSFATAETVAVQTEALWLSLRNGQNELAAEMAVSLVGTEGVRFGRRDEGWYWSRLSRALLEGNGAGETLLRGWLYQNEGNLAIDPAEALKSYSRALAVKEKVLPPDHPDVAASLNSVADALHRLGKNEEALRLQTRAQEIFARAYGPESVETAFVQSNRGEVLVELGRYEEAVPILRTAAARWERHAGRNRVHLGFPLTALGRALSGLGRHEEATKTLTRALRLREEGGADTILISDTRFALAQALDRAGGAASRTRAVASEAESGYRQAGDVMKAKQVAAWIAKHP